MLAVNLFVPGNFNSHAHVERDDTIIYICDFGKISTHTLTWSVTARLRKIKVPKVISTHTLTWSVTRNRDEIYQKNRISTHTLTWSVTFSASSKLPSSINFNSHAHVERDLIYFSSLSILFDFNSHAHVERDPSNLE